MKYLSTTYVGQEPVLAELGSRIVLALFVLLILTALWATLQTLQWASGRLIAAGPLDRLPSPARHGGRPLWMTGTPGDDDREGFAFDQGLVRDREVLLGPVGRLRRRLARALRRGSAQATEPEARLASVVAERSEGGERIAVLAASPHAGATTLVSSLAQVYADLHGDWVAMLELDRDPRVRHDPGRSALEPLGEKCPSVHARKPMPQNRFARHPDTAAVTRLICELEREYNRLLFDLGTSEGEWRDRVLTVSDRIVIVTQADADGDRAAQRLLDELTRAGHGGLVTGAVVVANDAQPRDARTQQPAPCGTHPTVAIGHERRFQSTAPLLSTLGSATRQDLFQLAALIASGESRQGGQTHPRPGGEEEHT